LKSACFETKYQGDEEHSELTESKLVRIELQSECYELHFKSTELNFKCTESRSVSSESHIGRSESHRRPSELKSILIDASTPGMEAKIVIPE